MAGRCVDLKGVNDTHSDWPTDLLDQYGYAVLHVATLRLTKPEKYLLLFALVEFYPKEIPVWVSTGRPKSKSLPGDPKRYAWVQRIVMSVEEAIRWYRSCLVGPPTIEYQGRSIHPEVFHLQSEPPWPFFVCVNDSLIIPFLAGWHDTPRLSQLISLSFVLHDYLKTSQINVTESFLQDEFHFPISQFPSLWGSINLLLPNPVIRKISSKLKEPHGPTGDTIIFNLIQRLGYPGTPPSDLLVQVDEERPSGTVIHSFAPEGYGTQELRLPYEIEGHHTYLISKQHGIIHSRGPAVFIRSVRANVNISVAERRLHVGNHTVAVSIINSGSDLSNKESPTLGIKYQDARTKLLEERSRQRAIQEGKSLGQQRFDNDRQGAVLAIIEKLRKTQKHLLIVDPYFGHNELEFISAVGDLSVPIQILTSAKFLKKDSEVSERTQKHGNLLAEKLRILETDQHANSIDVRVLLGDPSPVHDRFLLIDDTVWLLGNSFNGFGKTLSVMVVLPEPDSIKRELTNYWNKALVLSSWLKNRE